jgi:hypothetical protein
MHYKNGEEAREGDYVICQPDPRYDATICGRLHSLRAGDPCCEAQLCVPVMGGTTNYGVKVSQCFHAASAFGVYAKTIEQAKTTLERLQPRETVNGASPMTPTK